MIHTLLATIYAIRTRPDVYHLHAIGPALFAPLARLFGIRVVVTHHGADYEREKWGWLGRQVLRLGERVGMRCANGRISVSATIRELVADRHGVTCTFIPNGVNEPVATDSIDALQELGLDAGRYVLQVSRFVPEKRQADLVRAFLDSRLSPPWRLALVGGYEPDNDYAQQVQALAAGNDRIVLTGFRSGTELTELYQNAGIFVLPSSHEGLPIALLEALSFGLPVIASDIPANLEVGLPEHCYFALGALGQLADRLDNVAGGQQSPEACAERRRWVLERYDWQRIAAETVTVYQRALRNAPTAESPATTREQG